MNFEATERLKKLPPYLFAELDRMKTEAREAGRDIIDLGVGDPDLPTPTFVIEKLYEEAKNQANHQYPSGAGMLVFRQAVAKWLKNRFHIDMDPKTEIYSSIGSKEAIAHFPLAVLNPGDLALIPDPCYPPYKSGTVFAGGEYELMPLLKENDFFPDFKKISEATLQKAKLMFLNYPNNPTAACATKEFYEEAVRIAKKYNIIIASDLAYSEMAYDGFKPISIFEVDGARDVAIEFHSFSKTYNMTGWRIGFMCGNKELVALLGKVKANIDSGAFQAVQHAAIEAIERGSEAVEKNLEVFKKRRDLLIDGLKKLGYELHTPHATFYLWIQVPKPYTSQDFCMKVLEEANIIVTPGNGFGPTGEGYFRIALTAESKRLPEVIERLRKIKLS